MNWFVTTAIAPKNEMVVTAQQIAQKYQVPYLERRKRTVKHLNQHDGPCVIVYHDKLVYSELDASPLFFHPNTAWLRLLNGHDPLLEVIGNAPQTIIDATMGMATDSIVMSYAGHRVVAVEANPITELIVRDGLQRLEWEEARFTQAMRAVQTVAGQSLAYLQQQMDNSVDCVYFDPMFSQSIEASKNLDGIRTLADYRRLDETILCEAKRVARHRVIVKAHFRDDVFEQFGFTRLVRPNTKFHFGYLDCSDCRKQ